ncbi:MAG: adenosylmethionine--8-amino-7-oxononanoate transaminase [Cytophagales bacterium]|nr:adenosylmethionine--8-amino-7-oxononanoate transaminase [Cytophagales bacterium]
MSYPLWHPFDIFSDVQNLPVTHAQGPYLYTLDGRAILDGISSWWVNIHGHAHPLIAKAIAAQARKLEQIIFAGFSHTPALDLAHTLCQILPGKPAKVFFSDDGSTSVEVALKMAFQYYYNQGISKKKILAISGGYHGDTFGAMSVGHRGIFTRPFHPMLFDVAYIPLPTPDNKELCLNMAEQYLASGEVAAFIYEPLVQGSAGMLMYPPTNLDALLHLCKSYQVLTIADEVMTGFGRTGTLFASEQGTVHPDIYCLSKGITGGFMPLGATVCPQFIYDAFDIQKPESKFLHGHSYTANPIACAAATKSIEMLCSKTGQKNMANTTIQLQALAQDIKPCNKYHNVRQCGNILAFEIKDSTPNEYSSPMSQKLYSYFINHNILLRPLGNTIYIMPQYIWTDKEYNIAKNVLLEY